jgi:topoisomerase-4 subunit A
LNSLPANAQNFAILLKVFRRIKFRHELANFSAVALGRTSVIIASGHRHKSAVFFDAEQQFYYLKRFRFENVVRHTLFIGETEGSYLVALSGEKRPRFEVVFGGRYESRPAEVIVADEFIAEKSYKARGKRVTTYEVKQIKPLDSGEEESEETASTDIDFEITNPDMLSDETQMKLDFE